MTRSKRSSMKSQWRVEIDGVDHPCFGIVKGGRGIVLADKILLMTPVCWSNGAAVVDWPEVLPARIRARSLSPWIGLEPTEAEHKRLEAYYRAHLQALLEELDERSRDLEKMTAEDYIREFGDDSPDAQQRFKQWKGEQIQMLEARRRPLDGGFDMEGVHHEYTCDAFLEEHLDNCLFRLWEERVGPIHAAALRKERRRLVLLLGAAAPASLSSPSSRRSEVLLDSIRYEVEYPEKHLFLKSIDQVPHDLESLRLVEAASAVVPLSPVRANLQPSKLPLSEKKPGRKAAYDAKLDERWLAAWETGQYKVYAELANELNIKEGDLVRALQRARGRRRARRRG